MAKTTKGSRRAVTRHVRMQANLENRIWAGRRSRNSIAPPNLMSTGAKRLSGEQIHFDQLAAYKTEIDAAFGEPLSWERLDGKRGCRIRHTETGGGYRWPEDPVIAALAPEPDAGLLILTERNSRSRWPQP